MADPRGPLSFDDVVDLAAGRVARGESLASVLRAYPEHAATLRAPLSALEPVLAMTAASPGQQARLDAQRRMFSELKASPRRRASWLRLTWANLGARGLRLQAAAASLAVLLFGGLGLASAAGDRSPVPVPAFFRVLSTSSDSAVRLDGTVASVGGSSITVRTTHGDETASIDASTDIRIGDQKADVGALAVGLRVSVSAARSATGLRAARIVATPLSQATPAGAAGGPPSGDEGSTEPGDSEKHGGNPLDAAGFGDATRDDPGDGGRDAADDGAHDATSGHDSGEDGGEQVPAPLATAADDGGDDGHPQTTATPDEHDHEDDDATVSPRTTRTPEPTEQPEPTEPAEPTEQPEPTESH
jgi:hypothetical protein